MSHPARAEGLGKYDKKIFEKNNKKKKKDKTNQIVKKKQIEIE